MRLGTFTNMPVYTAAAWWRLAVHKQASEQSWSPHSHSRVREERASIVPFTDTCLISNKAAISINNVGRKEI